MGPDEKTTRFAVIDSSLFRLEENFLNHDFIAMNGGTKRMTFPVIDERSSPDERAPAMPARAGRFVPWPSQ